MPCFSPSRCCSRREDGKLAFREDLLSSIAARAAALAVATLAFAAHGEPLKVASPGFSFVGVDANTGSLYAEYFNRQLELHGDIRVTGPSELNAVLGLDRQRQLLGCAESSCMAELAGALGVDDVIVGQLGRAGSGWLVNIKVIRAKDASAVAVYSARIEGDNALLDYLGKSAEDLARRLGRAREPEAASAAQPRPEPAPPPEAVASGGPPDRTWMVTGALGAALLVGAGVTYGLGASQQSALANGTQTYASVLDVSNARFSGERLQATAFALGGSGLAVLGVAATQAYLPPSSTARHLAPWIAGGAALVAGVALDVAARGQLNQLQQNNSPTLSDFERTRSTGENEEAAGWTLIATGGAGLVGAAVLTFLPSGGPSLAVSPTAHGATVALSMEIP